MDIKELDRITNASIAIENADALLFDLYEDYFTDSDYKTLIYEAESHSPFCVFSRASLTLRLTFRVWF